MIPKELKHKCKEKWQLWNSYSAASVEWEWESMGVGVILGDR